MAEGQDILLGFVAETKAALEQVLAFVRESTRGLLALGETHPEVVVNVASAVESLRGLLAHLAAVRAGERDASGQPLTIDTSQVRERLDAVLGMLRGLNEDFLRLPDAAATAGAGAASGLDRIAEAERAAADGAIALREELVATASAAAAAAEREAEAQAPLVEGARSARMALSELFRSVASGSRSVIEEFAAADSAIEEFASRLRIAADAGTAIGSHLPAELSRLQAGLLAVANDAERAGVAIQSEAEEQRSAAAQIAEANRLISLAIQEVLVRSRLLESEGARGWDTLREPIERARLAVQRLESTIEEARAAGSPIPPGADEQLSLFQARLERAELAAQAAAEGVSGLRAAVRLEAEAERAAAQQVAEAQRAAAREVSDAQRIAALSIQEVTNQTRLFRAEGGRDWPAVQAAVNSARAAVEAYAAAVAHARAQGTPLAAGTQEQLALLQSRLAVAAAAADRARDSIRRLGDESDRASSGGLALLGRAINRIAFSIELMIAYQAARKIKEMGDAAVAAAEMGQRMAIGFEAAAGGARQGAEAEAFLRAEGQRLGFVVNEMAEGYIKFLTATRGANMAQDEQRALFSRTVETMVSMRAPQQQINQLLQTFAEIIDRGAASTAQLRRRLSDELPSGLANLRAVTGLTEGDLDKMTKGGQLGAEVLLSLITRISEEMGGGFRSAIDSATAADARLKDQMQESAAVAGERYLPALANLREEFRLLLKDSQGTAAGVGEFLANLAHGIEDIVQWYRVWDAEGKVNLLQNQINAAQIKGTSRSLAEASQLTMELAAAQEHLRSVSTSASEAAAKHSQEIHQEAMATLEALPLFVRRTEELANSGRVSSEVARAEVAAIDAKLQAAKSYDAADRQAMQAQLDRLLLLRDAFSRQAIDLTVALGQQIDSVRRYARDFEEELRRTGSVSKEAADKIVKDVQTQVKAIEQLPVAERAAFKEREAALKALLTEFAAFTTAYERLDDRQLKSAQRLAVEEARVNHQREVDLEKTIRRIAELGSKPIDRGAAGDLKGAQGDLAKQQEELNALRSKPTNTPEELARMDALQQSINKSSEAVKKLQQQQRDQVASGEAGNKALALSYETVYTAVKNLITEDDKFKAELAGLGPEAQAAFQHVTQGLLDAAQAGTVTEADFRRWGSEVAGIFVQAGVATQDFRQRLEANLSPLRTVAQMMDSLRNAAGQIVPGLAAAATAVSQTGSAATSAAAGVKVLTAAEREQAEIADVVAFAQRTLGLQSLDLAGKSPAVVAAFEAAARAARDDAQASDRAKAGTIEVSNAKGVLVSKTREAGEAWKTETENVKEGTAGLIQISQATVEAEKAQSALEAAGKVVVERTKEGVVVITQATSKRKEDTTAVKDAADKSKQLTTEVKTEQSATSQIAQDLPKVTAARQAEGAAAERAAASEQKGASALGQLGGAAASTAPALGKVADSMQRIAAADPGRTLGAAADANQRLLDSAQPLAVEIDKETFYLDSLDAMAVRLGAHLRSLATEWNAVTASMAAFRAEAQLDITVCQQLTACLQDQAAA
jgi:Tape measure protein